MLRALTLCALRSSPISPLRPSPRSTPHASPPPRRTSSCVSPPRPRRTSSPRRPPRLPPWCGFNARFDAGKGDGSDPTAPSSSPPSRSIFSSLPQPKSAPIFSSLPAPKSSPIFSAIPPPKSSAAASSASSGNPKCVIQFRPPPIRQPAGDSSDEEDDAEKRRPSASEALPPVPAGSGPVSSFLPLPKHSLGLGSSAAGARRSAIDTTAPERSNLGAADASNSAVNAGAPERPNTVSADEGYSEESGDEEDMPVPEEKYVQQEQQGFDAGAGQQQQQGYDAGVGSTNGHGGYAWDPNYYANYGANYGWDPSGNVNYGTGAQYAADGGELMKNRPREDKSKLTGMAFGVSACLRNICLCCQNSFLCFEQCVKL